MYDELRKAGTRMRRALLALLPALLLLPLLALRATAADWPDRPVRIVVPFAAGSTPDVVAHLLAERLQQRLGQPFIVENRPGASGNIGTDAVAKAAPDGYTVGVSIGGPLAINTLLFSDLPYDPAKDLALVTMIATQPSALAINPSFAVDSVPALIDLLKKNPGKYTFGSIGNGSLSHLAMEALALTSGTQMVHVPYTSSPQAVTALIRGDVQIVCLPAISLTPQAASGKLKILAITTAQRSDLLPGVPTLKETGIDIEADAWMGLIAPAKTPEPIIAKLQHEVAEVVTSPDMRGKLALQLMQPIPTTSAQFQARVAAEIVRWSPVIKAAHIRIE
jgi:tripartite-type tricarboxylate transporter receptor subunit TctC